MQVEIDCRSCGAKDSMRTIDTYEVESPNNESMQFVHWNTEYLLNCKNCGTEYIWRAKLESKVLDKVIAEMRKRNNPPPPNAS